MLLQDAEAAHLQAQQAIADDPAQASHLKDSVLLLLDVLGQCESMEARYETCKVLQRLFTMCSSHFRDAEAFQETPVDTPASQHVPKRGNVVLKTLLFTLHSLSSHSEMDNEILRALVDMIRILCLNTINATDVVALFDFLRLGRPPVRCWILQMQKTLVETDVLPRAFFTMRGANAGLIVPSDRQLITKKGYSCSFGLHVDGPAGTVALYSFRGHSGQGISVMLDDTTLIVKLVGSHKVVQQVEVPLVECAEKMHKEWVHLCIVHAKKMVFKDKLTVYVDGNNVFSGHIGYPDPSAMVGGRNNIGIEPLVGGLQGKLWSPTLFGVALTEAEVQRLHWSTHWKNDLNSVAAENLAFPDKSKMCFCYDARSCDLKQRICYDVSGNDCHGSLGLGTSAFVTHSFIHALDSVGGCACFLLLLLDQIPEMVDFHPTHDFEKEEISELLAFVGAGLCQSMVCRAHFARLQGVKVVAFILQSISPTYLSIPLLDGVLSILKAMTDCLERDEEIVEYIYRLLFLNTTWFLSPFETQVKLLGEVLPRYLQILQKARLREQNHLYETGSSSIGKSTISRAASFSDFSRSLNSKDQVNVSFFCRLISQVYTSDSSSDNDNCGGSQMNTGQLAQLCELVLQNLIDPLLFPLVEDPATDQWRQFLAYLLQECQSKSAKRSCNGKHASIEHILRYLTQNLASAEARKGAVSLPSRQLQVTTNIHKFSKGTVRALWRPLLSTNYNVRLASLRLFELYTSERVTLQKNDMLMLHSSLQPHTLTADIADLLLDIVIGRKRMPLKFSDEVRSGSFARMNYIPLVLLGLIHCGGFNVQAYVLAEIRVQLTSPTMGNSVKEAIRSWPSWLNRLRSLTLKASEAATAIMSDSTKRTTSNGIQSDKLNEACGLLSADSVSAYAKLKAIETIALSGDLAACDFALSMVQNCSENDFLTSAIVAMTIKHYPQRWCELVRMLANYMIVDIVVYCILHVKNGWMHFLEFYFYHCRTPSVLCSLTAVICEDIIRQVNQSLSTRHSAIIWENLCQVAALISQSSLVATKMTERLMTNDFVLSLGQETIFNRKAFELWQLVLPHLDGINWDGLVANLIENTKYGSGITPEEIELFTHLVASRSQSVNLLLQVIIRHVTLAQTSKTTEVDFIKKCYCVLDMLKCIVAAPDASASEHSIKSLAESLPLRLSSPRIVASIHDTALSQFADGIAVSSKDGTLPECKSPVPDSILHVHTLDACFTLLKSLLEASDLAAVRSLMEVMVALATTALHFIDSTARPELTKTLEILSSTDLSFFSDLTHFRELYLLWQLHFENYHICCDPVAFHTYVGQQSSDFIRRWLYIMENHIVDFNPYLVQQYASSQAEVLGNELQQCEMLWKEILDEDEAAEVNPTHDQDDTAVEARVVELKRSTEKFASSVHKLLILSSHESRPGLFIEGVNAANLGEGGISGNDNKRSGDGVILKIESKENNLRMRLRLKKVTEEYRARNVSCEYSASSLTDTESREGGKRLSRRFCGTMEGVMTDLNSSWQSDAGSEYNDFLVDAQVRAAIARSLSNPEEYKNAYGDMSDDDDLDAEETESSDAIEDDLSHQVVTDFQSKIDSENPSFSNAAKVGALSQVNPLASDSAQSPTADATTRETKTVARSSPSPVASLKASSSATSSIGFSTLVGGVADYLQKSVKSAKDAVEYGVDSLYTTKDLVAEEAHVLLQEVSTFVESKPGNNAMITETLAPIGPSVQLPPSSLELMETKQAVDQVAGSSSQLFQSTSSTKLDHDGGAKSANQTLKQDFVVNAQLVRHLHVVEGKLILSSSSLRFVAERVIDENEAVVFEKKRGLPVDKPWQFLFKRRQWEIDNIVGVYRRRYLLKPTALEIFIQSTRKNFFFNLISGEVVLFHEALMARRPLLLKRHPSVRRLRHPSSLFRNSHMSSRWVQHEISTFEYIMWLNTIAGRTYNDLTQYPVFPWILSDYESATLDLSRKETYRDLSKPMGALEPSRLQFYVDRYNAFEDPDIPKFMYGTHYSNIGAVLYYLVRLEPFTSYALSIQGGKFDHADRLFHSVAETWKNCLTDYTDLKELTPEWFYLPHFLVNCNGLNLGTRQNGVDVANVVLPPWARSPEDFVMKNLVALESEYVSANIHHWIDLVFGCKQRGAAAVKANNLFFYLTYEGMVDVDSIKDPIVKSSMQSQIAHFGQTPSQVLQDSHPPRQFLEHMVVTSSSAPLETSLPPSLKVLSIPHEAPIKFVKSVIGTPLIVCVDSNGMLSCHRFGSQVANFRHHHSSSKSKAMTRTSSSHGDQAIDFLELQDRKSRKVIGQTCFLSDEQLLSNSVALLHEGMMLCTVGHHDFSARFHSTVDGALLYRLLQHQAVVSCVDTSNSGAMLALGCTDGTMSVWKVTSTNSTLLDSLKLFRGAKMSLKPVHANNYSADQVLLGHNARINCLRISDELGVCISGSASNECLAHNLEDGAILHSFEVPGHLEPGVILIDLSSVGHVILQSMGTGVPILYSFHLSGALLAKHSLGDHPMTSLSICARYSKVVISNSEQALVMTAHTLDDQRVLLDQDTYGALSAQGLAPDERHAVFGVGNGKIVCCPILSPQMPQTSSEI